jgi:hypothetical protein
MPKHRFTVSPREPIVAHDRRRNALSLGAKHEEKRARRAQNTKMRQEISLES